MNTAAIEAALESHYGVTAHSVGRQQFESTIVELAATAGLSLENWLASRGQTPDGSLVEGFRLLALHRQGARGEPSFNACRETCRELVYHHNCALLLADGRESGLPSARGARSGRSDAAPGAFGTPPSPTLPG